VPRCFPYRVSTGPYVAPPEPTFPFLNGKSMPQDTPGRKRKAPSLALWFA
jgi:hypothetical protein